MWSPLCQGRLGSRGCGCGLHCRHGRLGSRGCGCGLHCVRVVLVAEVVVVVSIVAVFVVLVAEVVVVVSIVSGSSW